MVFHSLSQAGIEVRQASYGLSEPTPKGYRDRLFAVCQIQHTIQCRVEYGSGQHQWFEGLQNHPLTEHRAYRATVSAAFQVIIPSANIKVVRKE